MQQLSQGEGNVGDQNGGNGEFMGDRTLSLGGGCGFDVFLGNAGWRCDYLERGVCVCVCVYVYVCVCVCAWGRGWGVRH